MRHVKRIFQSTSNYRNLHILKQRYYLVFILIFIVYNEIIFLGFFSCFIIDVILKLDMVLILYPFVELNRIFKRI